MVTCGRPRLLFASTVAIACLGQPAEAGSSVLVAGFSSDNVVRFEIPTGASEVIANFAPNDRPRGIALDRQGEVYVSLRGGTQNIVKLVPDPAGSGLLIPIDFTESIRGFGPGMISFNEQGNLIAAGGASRVVFRYNGTTGDLIDSFTHFGCCNILGLMADGDFVYATEFFQRRILRFDLSFEPVGSESFIPATDQLDQPIGMTIGHTGNLFVVNLQSGLIQEFSTESGEFIGTFIDLGDFGFSSPHDIHYAPVLGSYFVTSGDSLLRFPSTGDSLTTYQNVDLVSSYGIAVILCPADVNGDGVVNVIDLIRLLMCFGQPAVPGCEAEDVNRDGTVNVLDLIDLLLNFGTTCP